MSSNEKLRDAILDRNIFNPGWFTALVSIGEEQLTGRPLCAVGLARRLPDGRQVFVTCDCLVIIHAATGEVIFDKVVSSVNEVDTALFQNGAVR
jgi:hypothetical protein